ncbi:MAG: 3-dehydroquinate synthase [Thermoanaerobaculia bacterium]
MSGPEEIAIGSGGAWIGPGLLAAAASRLVSASGRYLLVSSAGSRAVAEILRRALAGRLLLDLEIDDREESKNLRAVERIADAALAAGLRRDDAFVAVGGGVVCDIVGFAGAILLRGVTWNAVPTTTGAMADAAIGGKTGVDHPAGKNLLGAFHPPATILIDPAAVATLSDRDYRSGLVEAFKAAWIANAALASRAEASLEAILARDERALLDLVAGAVRIKAEIVSSDPKEADRRRLLNFGHTLGHAFEAAGGYRDLRHGEAVAWGIGAALRISARRANLPEAAAARVRRVLARLGPFPEPRRDPEALAVYLAHDKKASAHGIAGVLLEGIGRARIEEAVPLEEWLEAAARTKLS